MTFFIRVMLGYIGNSVFLSLTMLAILLTLLLILTFDKKSNIIKELIGKDVCISVWNF